MRPRRTRQLDAVEAVLRDAGDHPTAAQIHERVAALVPRVSLGTVYRNLEKLVQSGCILSLRLEGAVTRYDGRVDPHHHFICQACGRIADLTGDAAVVDMRPLERAGYAVAAHALAIYGNCPDCG